MKKILTIVILLSMLIMLSVPAFATSVPPYYTTEDGNTIFGVFDTKSLSSDQKEFLEDFLTGDKVRWAYFSSSDVAFCMDLLPTYNSSNSSYLTCKKTTRVVGFKWDSLALVYKPTASSVVSFSQDSALDMSKFKIIMSFPDIVGAPNSFFWGYEGDLILRDNDGLFGGGGDDGGGGVPDPEIPVIPPAQNFPEIGPVSNEYVPYDTTIWNTFLDWITKAIGNSTNIGFLLFAYILGILIVIAVVKKFAKP